MFWVNEKDLDEAQRQAVQSMPESASFLVRGPAGSGKTNVLLLRAKWFKAKKLSDFKIVVFTSSLRDFLQAGCTQYRIPTENVVTCFQFMRDLLSEYGGKFEPTKNFEIDRELLAGKVHALLDKKNVKPHIEALLVDECQDLMDTELLILRRVAKRLVVVADSRQSIYRTTHTPDLLESLVNNSVINLKYHYRSGMKLCAVADEILKDSSSFAPMRAECKYNEDERPSSVTLSKYASLDKQFSAILEKLPGQLDLYPGERIGVLFPKNEQRLAFEEALEASSDFPGKDRVYVDTIHGAKGWEFRAVHVAGCEALYKMGPIQKRLAYTAVLRGRTSAAFYYTGSVPGYLESAVAKLEAPKPDPSLSALFDEDDDD